MFVHVYAILMSDATLFDLLAVMVDYFLSVDYIL